jgi:hypothetical protein
MQTNRQRVLVRLQHAEHHHGQRHDTGDRDRDSLETRASVGPGLGQDPVVVFFGSLSGCVAKFAGPAHELDSGWS